MQQKQIIVIGGGAAGMMAAGRAAESGNKVLLLEKMEKPGKKILITGNGRCNLTNEKEINEFLTMFGTNGKFLRNAFHRFFRQDLLTLLKRFGLEAVTETDGRIFPKSGKAEDVVTALKHYLHEHNVVIQTNTDVTDIKTDNEQIHGVHTNRGYYSASAVILAVGGSSYPKTGSNGDGFRIAEKIGHTITPLRPALIPLKIKELEMVQQLQGVSLQHIRLSAFKCKTNQIKVSDIPPKEYGRGLSQENPPANIIESRIGELLFTHYGISGPTVLQMSLAIVDALSKSPVSISIDLFPYYSAKQLDQKIQDEFRQHSRMIYRTVLDNLLPHTMVKPFADLTSIPLQKRINQINSQERDIIVASLKSLRFTVTGSLPLEYATVTAGGVSLKEIDPKTMASKLVRGLYFCGEVMDIDADTGGYNLQAAFSTGYIAGESAADYTTSINTR